MKSQQILEQSIRVFNEAYRKGNPLISDSQYDLLIEELKEKYPNSELLKKGVLEDIPQARKQKLPYQMASLEKVKSRDEIMSWVKSLGLSGHDLLVVTPKYDGISLCVEELRGVCYTRGDGVFGQRSDKHYSQLNFSKSASKDFFSFGEAVIPKSVFQEKYADKYKSARNLVAGLFNRNEPTEELRDVSYMRFGSDQSSVNKIDQLKSLIALSDEPLNYIVISVHRLLSLFPDKINEIYKDWGKRYQIDGLVVEVNSSFLRSMVGRHDNGNPKYAVAYKNPEWSETFITSVKGIEINVSKQGKLKPVIVIEPVNIDGVTVERVTGYNAKYIFDNDIAEGSKIEIIRSGDVIPKHLRTIGSTIWGLERLYDDLTCCPECGTQVKWDETDTELICPNEKCKGREISKLEHFFKTLKIEDFSRPSILQFYNQGYKTIKSILEIDSKSLSEFPGWGERSANSLLSQFKALKDDGVPYARLLHALDVFKGLIGEKTCQLILDNFPGDLTIENLEKIDGIARKTAEVFIDGVFDSKDSRQELPIKTSYIKTPEKSKIGDKFRGFKVCFTGVRDKVLEEEIIAQGGEVVSGVSKTTTHLVTKDMEEKTLNSSKAKKAKELGIEIIDLQTFKTK